MSYLDEKVQFDEDTEHVMENGQSEAMMLTKAILQVAEELRLIRCALEGIQADMPV